MHEEETEVYGDAVRRASDAECSVRRYVAFYGGGRDFTVAKLCKPHPFLPADHIVVALIRQGQRVWVKLFVAQRDSLWVMSKFTHPCIDGNVFDALGRTSKLPSIVDCGAEHLAFSGFGCASDKSEMLYRYDVCITRDPDTWDYSGSIVWAAAAVAA